MAYQRQYKPYRNNRGNTRGGYGHQRGGYAAQQMTPVTAEQVMANFNPSLEQGAIFDWRVNNQGDLIVNALAGSGKTTTLKQFVARLDVSKDNVIFCAFSKAIEQEVKPQLFGLCEVKTTYALGLAAVRSVLGEQLRRAGNQAVQEDKYKKMCRAQSRLLASRLRMASNNSAIDNLFTRTEAEREVGEVRMGTKVPQERELNDMLIALVNHCQMNLVDPNDLPAVQALVDHHNVELSVELAEIMPVVDAILSEGIEMAKHDGVISYGDMVWLPHVLNIDAPQKFLYILVDEAQDINAAQREMILKLRARGGRIVWVGDRHQAIFGFASADAYSFDTIKKQTGASELPLNTCYRCPQSALELARAIVPTIQPAPDAPLGTVSNITESELMSIAREGDMLLCRLTAPLITVCLQMIARKIPARVKGKDVGKTVTGFLEAVADQIGFSYEKLPEFVERHVTKMTGRLSRRDGNEMQIEAVKDRAEAVMVCYNNFTECDTTDELVAAIEDLFTEDRPGITLSTVHRAKGLEAERVFILRPEKLPLVWKNQKAWQYEQEQNLRYVALTRVKFNRKTGFEGELYFVN